MIQQLTMITMTTKPNYNINDTIICLYDGRKYIYTPDYKEYQYKNSSEIWLVSSIKSKPNIWLYDDKEDCWATIITSKSSILGQIEQTLCDQEKALKHLERINQKLTNLTKQL
jgi:hypothetical protein